jgi:hypothetical protein
MLLADLMNGFIYEVGNFLQTTNARTIGIWAFALPGGLYLLFGLLYIVFCPCIHCERLLNQPAITIIKILISIFSLIGLILYLVGDNYHLIKQINERVLIITLKNTTRKVEILNEINAIQPSFLLLSLLFHRAVPQILMIIARKINREEEREDDMKFNDSFFIGIMSTLLLTTELDSWFTMVQATTDCSSQLKWVWATWILLIVVYAVHISTNSISGVVCGNQDEADTQCYGGACMIVFLVIAFAMYLLGDNRQPLDCYPISAFGRSAVKLLFIVLAATIYVIILIFYGIGCCACKDIFVEDKYQSLSWCFD